MHLSTASLNLYFFDNLAVSKCVNNPRLHSITLNSRQLPELCSSIYKVKIIQDQQAIVAVTVYQTLVWFMFQLLAINLSLVMNFMT